MSLSHIFVTLSIFADDLDIGHTGNLVLFKLTAIILAQLYAF